MADDQRWEDLLDEELQDPTKSVGHLDACLEGGDRNAFLTALRDIVQARGGLTKIAEGSSLNLEHLGGILSENEEPDLRSLDTLLDALGFRLKIKTKERH
jgi:DNA-binding phage protein